MSGQGGAVAGALDETLLWLCAIDSPIGEERALCDAVLARMGKLALPAPVRRYGDSIVVPIAAVTFEIQRVFARYCTTGPLRALLWPGFLVQKVTTIEPDDDQLEVALASLRATLWRERAEAMAPAESTDRTFADFAALSADPGYGRAA